jgi:hypothetical protein
MDKKKDKKGQPTFECKKCAYLTSHRTKYQKHLQTMKHKRILLDTQKGQGKQEPDTFHYVCECCHYVTSHKTKYERHTGTAKHEKAKRDKERTKKDQKGPLGELKNGCASCGKAYAFPSGLQRHKKKCPVSLKESNESKLDNLAEKLQKTNEVVLNVSTALSSTNGTLNKICDVLQSERPMQTIQNIQTIQNQKIQNKNVNIQFFLNEECKNAISISSFVASLKPTLEDLENVCEKGYVKGMTSLIVEKLKELDVYTRPIHNLKKQIYLKENEWESDTKKVAKFVKNVAIKNMGNISEWKRKHPEHTDIKSSKNMQYLKMVQECIGGEDEVKNTHKIIQNISKEIL